MNANAVMKAMDGALATHGALQTLAMLSSVIEYRARKWDPDQAPGLQLAQAITELAHSDEATAIDCQ